MEKKHFITKWLETSHAAVFNSYCIIAAFFTYFCMYAFRKPFSIGTFEGKIATSYLGNLDYKIVLIISQVIGYALSKFIGIKVISEMTRERRAITIICMLTSAELALLGFALVPKPYNILFIFLNGIPLGMIWGLVFAFLEGRRSSELLGAGLSASYIIASGAVKSVGRWVLMLGVSEFWMPFVTGAIFFPFMLFFVYLLKLIPPPTQEDQELRTKRVPMNNKERKQFFFHFAPGLISLIALYMFLTAYRDFRDNFAREIWDALGYQSNPVIFTTAELPVALGVLFALALLMLIKDNKKALVAVHLLMMGGSLLIGISTFAYEIGVVGPASWMIAVGLGLYLGYVPYGCVLFDRMIAYVGKVANAGFLIYVADAFGYTGSIVVMLYKNFGQPNLKYLSFFKYFSYATALVCTLMFGFSLFYFMQKKACRGFS